MSCSVQELHNCLRSKDNSSVSRPSEPDDSPRTGTGTGTRVVGLRYGDKITRSS